MPDEDKFVKNTKKIVQSLKANMIDRFSGRQTIKINWNQGGITEIKEVTEEDLK